MIKKKKQPQKLTEEKRKFLSDVERQLVTYLKELGSLPPASLKSSDLLYEKLQSFASNWRDEV